MRSLIKVKERRLVLMVDPELMNRIDDYRYKNRIPSRSEAIRRLCEESLSRAESEQNTQDKESD